MTKLKHLFIHLTFLFFLSLLSFSVAYAGNMEEMERRLNILADEIEELMLESDEPSEKKVHLHGYGELHYNNTKDGDKQMDMHRMVLGAHVLLTDWIHLNFEVDFEHAAQELELEFSYLDFLIDPRLNFRAGVVLIPVGFLNEFHEPPLYWTVERPELQKVVIPTTWMAAGGGIFGQLGEGLKYRLYGVNSVQSVREDGAGCGAGALGLGGACGSFRAKDGIRKGRRQLDEAIAEDFAATGRIDYSGLYPGLQLGFSFYTGDSTQGLIDEGGRVTLLEGDVKYRWRWFDMNATVVNIFIDDAEEINEYNEAQGTASGVVPDNIFGWNVQAGVHLFQLLNLSTSHDLIPFILYEDFDLQDSVPDGYSPNYGLDTQVITAGFSYMPDPNVALKFDYQCFDYGNDTSKNQFNMAVTYMF